MGIRSSLWALFLFVFLTKFCSVEQASLKFAILLSQPSSEHVATIPDLDNTHTSLQILSDFLSGLSLHLHMAQPGTSCDPTHGPLFQEVPMSSKKGLRPQVLLESLQGLMGSPQLPSEQSAQLVLPGLGEQRVGSNPA